MAKDKIDHLTEIVKLGFANLDTRIEKGFAAVADDIDDLEISDYASALARDIAAQSSLFLTMGAEGLKA